MPEEADPAASGLDMKVGEMDCGKNGKPGTVIGVDPHSPKAVSKGAVINLTLCAG